MAYRPTTPLTVGQVSMQPIQSTRRITRDPIHDFSLRFAPWVIQPCAIAPVLPNDTLMRASLQMKVVSDPLFAKLRGWTLETHWFFVPVRALSVADEMMAMMLNPYTATGLSTVASAAGFTYRVAGRPDFTKLCLDAVVNEYFRDEGTTSSDYTDTVTGAPLAKHGYTRWDQSVVETTEIDDGDVKVDIDNSGTITASEVDFALTQWQMLRQNGLTNQTYDDWRAQFGVRIEPVRETKPELLRSIRSFSAPTVHVEPTTGTPTVAMVWNISERFKKRRNFKDAGFILGVVIAKPKFYARAQNGALANLMDSAFMWMPPVLRDDPSTSTLAIDSVSGPLATSAGAGTLPLTVDMRDLFLYGDQFLAARPSVAGADSVPAGGIWSTTGSQAIANMGIITDQHVSVSGHYERDFIEISSAQDPLAAVFAGSTNETRQLTADGRIQFVFSSSVYEATPGVPVRGAAI